MTQGGKVQVIKIGGELVGDEKAIQNLVFQARKLADAGGRVFIVHGGGVQITEELAKAGIKAEFINGLRHTSADAVEITERCLRDLNAGVVALFDGGAVGIGGYQGGIIRAVPVFEGTRTGTVSHVDRAALLNAADGGKVCVIYPICAGPNGEMMNVNADDVAAAVAEGVGADRLILCSNIPGVMDKQKKVFPRLYIDELAALIADETITGGMIPKVQSAARIAENPSVGGVVILNGADIVAIEKVFSDGAGAGTLIQRR